MRIGVFICILGIIHVHKTRPKHRCPKTKLLKLLPLTDCFHFTTLLNTDALFALKLESRVFSLTVNKYFFKLLTWLTKNEK